MTIKKARTLADILAHPMVESTHTEDDGCFTDSRGRRIMGRWVYLKDGFISPDMECGTIHEATVAECCDKLNNCITRAEWEAI